VPDDENDREMHKAWERALEVTDRAACAELAEPATCLRDMELNIRAWAFTAEVNIGNDLGGSANWRPGDDLDSKFIAPLGDDIRLIKRLVGGANIVVGSIVAVPTRMPNMLKRKGSGRQREERLRAALFVLITEKNSDTAPQARRVSWMTHPEIWKPYRGN
jgi:hypothetical protein